MHICYSILVIRQVLRTETDIIMNELLARVGWSQRYFASRIGVDERTVGRWCNGKDNSIAIAYLEMVSRVLGV